MNYRQSYPLLVPIIEPIFPKFSSRTYFPLIGKQRLLDVHGDGIRAVDVERVKDSLCSVCFTGAGWIDIGLAKIERRCKSHCR